MIESGVQGLGAVGRMIFVDRLVVAPHEEGREVYIEVVKTRWRVGQVQRVVVGRKMVYWGDWFDWIGEESSVGI